MRGRVLLLAALVAAISLVATLPALVLATPQRLVVGLPWEPLPVGASLWGSPILHADPSLAFVVVDAVRADVARDPRVRYVHEDALAWSTSLLPADPMLGAQYGPQQVRAPEAWSLFMGGEARSVCVVDSGLRWSHEEFRDGRLRGGWDFVAMDAEPWDMTGHGTHVAGIAVAAIGNGVGIAGIANAPLYVVRTAANDSHYESALASGIAWCADQGADIINLSMASTENQVMRDAIVYAHGKGALLVGASGNRQGSCLDCVNAPAKWPEVLAVGCTDAAQRLCGFSKQGPEMDLVAPGDLILSATKGGDASYYPEKGTSMSAPHVSGVAALVWNARPELPRDVLRDVLLASARDLGPPGHDASYGWGLVDARAALDMVWPRADPVCFVSVDGRVVAWSESGAVVVGGSRCLDGDGDGRALG